MTTYETAEQAWHRIATRKHDHPLERIGRKVFHGLSKEQFLEVLAAVCKNNLQHPRRVPDLADPLGGVVQDDAEVFASFCLLAVPSGGQLSVRPIEGGFECKWSP